MPSAPPSDSARPSSPRRGPRLRIVHVNDVYSLENLPRLATLIQHYRTTDPPDAFMAVLAGDFVAPSMLSSLDRGRGMVACLNAAGITHVTFGNHEDDIPVAELHRRIAEFQGTWLSTNLAGFDPAAPVSQVLTVTAGGGGRIVRVGLVGVVMTDPAVYRRAPFGGAPLDPAVETVLRQAARLRDFERCDLVIPITHESLHDDRALITAARAASSPFPFILGGHEHDVHVEQDDGTWIVKAGSEAARAAVLEVEWAVDAALDVGGLPAVSVQLEPVAGYAEDAPLRALVDELMGKVHELEAAVLLPLDEGETLSSVGTRARQTSLGTLVCSCVRSGVAGGADACLINGGGIRAGRDYTAHLAFGDIKAELPFDNEMVVVSMPGGTLAAAVEASRALAPLESGGFLQVDDGVVVDEHGKVTAVAGAPLDRAREYRVATVRSLLTGMDHIEPLVEFAREHPERIPPVTTGRELKEVLVEALALALWRRLGGFAALDADRDGRVCEADVSAGIARLTREPASPLTVTLVMNAVDRNHDHAVTRDEADLVAR